MVLLHLRLRGLVGFVRDGDYYNVITDHAGSTQLVLKEELAASSSPRLIGVLIRTFYDMGPKMPKRGAKMTALI